MNRTLLLILCDFLLLTLLALTRWETAEPERPSPPALAAVEGEDGAATVADEIVELMKLSFEDQQAEQDAMAAELAAREAALAGLEQEHTELSRHLTTTQEHAAQLNQQLESVSSVAAASRARVDQLQREVEEREAEAARQAEELAKLTEEQAQATEQIEDLNVAVRVAEQEKVMLRETADALRQQADVERQERLRVQETNVQLAEGVGQLAEKSAEITAAIRDNSPINANTLFSNFLLNRVPASMSASRSGLFGNDVTRRTRPRTILASDGTATYAVLHVEDTVFNLTEPVLDWDRIEVQLDRAGERVTSAALHFLARDPRLVAIPVTAAQVEKLGVQVYQLATDPFRFPEAVLINNGGQGYGEVPFKLEAALPGYVRMDRRFVRRLVGEFLPSRGDLVLSKTGELLGIMVTADLCALLDNFSVRATLLTGDTSDQSEAGILQTMRQSYERRTSSGPRRR